MSLNSLIGRDSIVPSHFAEFTASYPKPEVSGRGCGKGRIANRSEQFPSLIDTSFDGPGFRQRVERRKSALGWFGRLLVFQPPGLLRRAAQQELDLRVEAAQIVVRPALDGVQHRGVDPKEERFTIGHDRSY